jgi:hypothetical protein
MDVKETDNVQALTLIPHVNATFTEGITMTEDGVVFTCETLSMSDTSDSIPFDTVAHIFSVDTQRTLSMFDEVFDEAHVDDDLGVLFPRDATRHFIPPQTVTEFIAPLAAHHPAYLLSAAVSGTAAVVPSTRGVRLPPGTGSHPLLLRIMSTQLQSVHCT